MGIPGHSFNFTSPNLTEAKAATEYNLKIASGYDCGSDLDCLQEDGSGYYVLSEADSGGHPVTHFNWLEGPKANTTLAQWYLNRSPWGFVTSLNWLATAA